MSTPNGFPVSSQLRLSAWSSEETAAYEAAIEAANGAVGAYSARIAAEEAKDQPDAEAIAQTRAARGRLAKEREALRPTDHQQVADARRRYTRLAQQVRQGTA